MSEERPSGPVERDVRGHLEAYPAECTDTEVIAHKVAKESAGDMFRDSMDQHFIPAVRAVMDETGLTPLQASARLAEYAKAAGEDRLISLMFIAAGVEIRMPPNTHSYPTSGA
jgi:hypothetical protein